MNFGLNHYAQLVRIVYYTALKLSNHSQKLSYLPGSKFWVVCPREDIIWHMFFVYETPQRQYFYLNNLGKWT